MYVHKTVKDALDTKQNEYRDFPNRMRSYQVYEIYQDHIKNYKKFNDVCADLREDAMKAKHWKDMLSKLKIMDRGKSEIIKRENLHLTHLWCADLLGRSKVVNDVLT